MTMLAWPALLLLGAALALVVLAALQPGVRPREVGTLIIWRRVAAGLPMRRQRRRSLDLLLWLLLGAAVLGALGAARPAIAGAERRPVVAVYVESSGPYSHEDDLAVKERAEANAPDATFTYYMPTRDSGKHFDLTTLAPGTSMSEVAAFEARTGDASGRILLLNEPWAGAESAGLVIPRQAQARQGVVFDVGGSGSALILRGSSGPRPRVMGASFVDSQTVGDVTAWRYTAQAAEVSFTDSRGKLVTLARPPFVIGVGADWNTDAHTALYAALGADAAGNSTPVAWLGGAGQTPAIRINQGSQAELAGTTLAFDPGQALFHDLPLESLHWTAEGRVLQAQPEDQALLIATRENQPVGALVLLRGNVLLFAGDPFSRSPVASAALLLDNAVGVVAGTRPSDRPGYAVAHGELPTRRQALARPFPPRGSLDGSTAAAERTELSSWLLAVAALALVCAAGVTIKVGRAKVA